MNDGQTPAQEPESLGDLPTLMGQAVPLSTLNLHDDVDKSHPPQGPRFHSPVFFGAGGMGRIFTAIDGEIHRTVALKDMRPHLCANPLHKEKFITEAEITGRLEHPGIAPVYSLHKPPGDEKPFYAMRYIEGDSLEDLIRAFHNTPNIAALSSEQTVAIRRLFSHFLSICQTIAYAHSRGYLHRDLKPRNIRIGNYGETVVLDWGLAIERDKVVSESPGLGRGTPGYWAPEQAEDRPHDQDERTDVYGLGAVLFTILTGRSPHPLGTHYESPPSPKELAPWVDEALDAIVRKSLAKSRKHRYQTVREFAEAVELWLANQPLAAQRDIVERMREHLALHGPTPVNEEQFARQLANLGAIYQGMGRDVEATLALLDAAGIFQKLFDASTQPRFRAEKANCLVALATSYKRLGDPHREEKSLNEAMLIYRGLVATNPQDYEPSLVSMMLTRAGEGARPANDQIAIADKPVDEDLHTADYAPADDLKTLDIGTLPPASGTVQPSDDREITEGYSIIAMLGEGGAGRVFLARDHTLGRKVAIKEAHVVPGGKTAQRFLREAQITANLSHPGIVRIFSHGRRAGADTPFIIREYVEGIDFRRLIYDRGEDDSHLRRCVRILAHISDALHYAHTKGVIHRDPKPMNVIVDAFDLPKVIDWGLAKIVGEPEWLSDLADHSGVLPDHLNLTADGAILGTPAYMSPEQARGESGAIRSASDLFTLGVTLYEILTGMNPFRETGDVSESMRRIANGIFLAPRSVRATIPRHLEAICLKAMALEPQNRYPTVAEFADDLRDWLAARQTQGISTSLRGLFSGR